MTLPKGKTDRDLGLEVGQKFRVVTSEYPNLVEGDTVTLMELDGSDCPYFYKGNDKSNKLVIYLWNLEPLLVGLDNLQVGDVVVEDGDEQTILAVLANGVYLLSRIDDQEWPDGWYTAKELKDKGFVVKNGEQVQPREITMAEVEEKFGEKVVIKREEDDKPLPF